MWRTFRRVDGELGIESAETVFLGADRQVVPGAEKFSMCIQDGQLVV